MEKKEYTAKSIAVLKALQAVRKNYNLNELSNQIRERGDITKLARKLNIPRHIFSRAIIEFRGLSKFPNIKKSKTQLLKSFKTERELVLFLTSYNLYKSSFRDLKKRIQKFYNNLSLNPLSILTKEQHDILIGSGLGDSNFRNRNNKNVSFRVGHSRKQNAYLRWKFDKFKEFILKGIKVDERRIKGHKREILHFSTTTHPAFNFYYKLFYKNKKKRITNKLLNYLNESSLAIWICDDGSYCKSSKNIILCTNSFSLKEHKLMKAFFKKRWDLDPTIGFRDEKYYYLKFTVADTRKLVNIIKPFIPVKDMRYKVNK